MTFYYIRILRLQEKLEESFKYALRVVFTITSDLGEVSYPQDATVRVEALDRQQSHSRITISKQCVSWIGNGHAAETTLYFPASHQQIQLTLHLENQNSIVDSIHINADTVFPVWSEAFSPKSTLPNMVWRYIQGPEKKSPNDGLWFLEQMGNSIAKHLWDAGVVFSKKILSDDWHYSFSNRKDINVLELGSGCGIVGISIASKYPRALVSMTDTEDAIEFMEKNVEKNKSAMSNNITSDILVWGHDIPQKFRRHWDYIVMSDVMYNESSFSDLEASLQELMDKNTKLYIAYKKRHDNEKTFMSNILGWLDLVYEERGPITIYILQKK
ncbi:Methyltransferase [Schizosaccharomyces pombe]